MANKAKETAKAKRSPDTHKETPPVATKKPQGSGKFTKGNRAGAKSWKPSNRKKQDMLAAFKSAISMDDMKAIAKKLVMKAKLGDTRAAQQVLDRCLGKVKEQVSLSLSGDTQDFLDYMGENYGGLPG